MIPVTYHPCLSILFCVALTPFTIAAAVPHAQCVNSTLEGHCLETRDSAATVDQVIFMQSVLAKRRVPRPNNTSSGRLNVVDSMMPVALIARATAVIQQIVAISPVVYIKAYSTELLPPQAAIGLDSWDAFDTFSIACIVVVLAFTDMIIYPRLSPSIASHLLMLALMFAGSACFCMVVWAKRGRSDAVAWIMGYAVEWLLSMDNLFVFHLIFKAFAVPASQGLRALTFGIYGAVVFRIFFIFGLLAMFKLSYLVDIFVGLLLIVSGFLALRDDDDEDIESLRAVRFFKWLFGPRLTSTYTKDGAMLTRGEAGEVQMTMLALVVCTLAVVDVLFAFDSVGSKAGQIKNPYLNMTSSLLAMFSLRSLFFIIKDVADYFEYVKYGICGILCFVGAEMIFSRWHSVPLEYQCPLIVGMFAISVAASFCKAKSGGEDKKLQASETAEEPSDNVPRLGG